MKAKDQIVFLNALDELEKEKGINKEELLLSIETALLAAYKKNYGEAENAFVEINRKTGEVKIKAKKIVVEKVENPSLEVLKSNVRGKKLGEEVDVEIVAESFKRNAIQNAKQIVIQKVREYEKINVYNNFKRIENSLIFANVKKMDENGNLYVEINNIEAIIPYKDLNPSDKFVQGDRISIYVGSVEEGTKYIKVDFSRRNEIFLTKLLEREIPEIANGYIQIKAISREAGVRSKVAVHSDDKNLDIKGACIGKNGVRIQSILSELSEEKLDIVLWDEDIRLFVKNALSPAEIFSIEILEIEDKLVARVEVSKDQLSLAIGKKVKIQDLHLIYAKLKLI